MDSSFKRPQESCTKNGRTIRRRKFIILMLLMFSFVVVKGVVADEQYDCGFNSIWEKAKRLINSKKYWNKKIEANEGSILYYRNEITSTKLEIKKIIITRDIEIQQSAVEAAGLCLDPEVAAKERDKKIIEKLEMLHNLIKDYENLLEKESHCLMKAKSKLRNLQ